jgi:hypothetical protein
MHLKGNAASSQGRPTRRPRPSTMHERRIDEDRKARHLKPDRRNHGVCPPKSGRYVSSELVSPLKQSNFCLPPTETGAERIRFLTALANKGEEVQMMAALLSLGLLGAQPVSNRMPEVKVHALCKARSADAKLMRLAETRTVAKRVNDEDEQNAS